MKRQGLLIAGAVVGGYLLLSMSRQRSGGSPLISFGGAHGSTGGAGTQYGLLGALREALAPVSGSPTASASQADLVRQMIAETFWRQEHPGVDAGGTLSGQVATASGNPAAPEPTKYAPESYPDWGSASMIGYTGGNGA